MRRKRQRERYLTIRRMRCFPFECNRMHGSFVTNVSLLDINKTLRIPKLLIPRFVYFIDRLIIVDHDSKRGTRPDKIYQSRYAENISIRIFLPIVG